MTHGVCKHPITAIKHYLLYVPLPSILQNVCPVTCKYVQRRNCRKPNQYFKFNNHRFIFYASKSYESITIFPAYKLYVITCKHCYSSLNQNPLLHTIPKWKIYCKPQSFRQHTFTKKIMCNLFYNISKWLEKWGEGSIGIERVFFIHFVMI